MYYYIKAEFLKIKDSFTYWFTIISAALIPLILFLVYLFRHTSYIPKTGENPWDRFFEMNLSLAATLFFPFYIILSTALNLNIEHKEDSWKKIFLLPITRTSIYLSKAVFLLLQTIFALLLFLLSIIVFGYILGLVHPDLSFLEYSINFLLSLKLLLGLFVSILAMFSIQYVLSLFFSNMIIPVATGMFCVITAIVISTKWEYALYYPYSFSSIFYYNYLEMLNIETWYGMPISVPLSIGVFIVVMFLGSYLFKRKQLR